MNRRSRSESAGLLALLATLALAPAGRAQEAGSILDAVVDGYVEPEAPAESAPIVAAPSVEASAPGEAPVVPASAPAAVVEPQPAVAQPAVAQPAVAQPAVAQPAPTPSPSAQPQVVTTPATQPAQDEKKDEQSGSGSLLANPAGTSGSGGFHLMFSYYQSLSNGTFVGNFGARDPTWSNYLLLQPSYGIDKDTTVALRTTWNYEFTKSDLPNGRSFSPDDWALLVNRVFLREKTDGFGLTAGPRASIPVSYESRFSGRYSSVSLAAILSKTIAGQFASLTFSAAKTLNRYTAAGVTPEEAAGNSWGGPGATFSSGGLKSTADIARIAQCRPDEALCASAGMNANYGFGATLLLAGGLPLLPEEFSYYLQFGLRSNWNYARPVDQYTPQTRDVNGNLVADGSGRATDLSVGSAGVSYQATSLISVDLWVSSFQPVLGNGTNRDPSVAFSRSLRFPFWDFSSYANNFSSIGLGVSGQI